MSSMFNKNRELTPDEVERLNAILPEDYRRPTWNTKDFFGHNGLVMSVKIDINVLFNKIHDEKTRLKKEGVDQEVELHNHIKIFSTELYEAKPLGLVDVGVVAKFAAPSTGDRFYAGAIGYAVESAVDNAKAKSGQQFEGLELTKKELLKKAKALFPECNMLFKYDVRLRELGSSGNVFIYMTATAAIGSNPDMEQAEKAIKELDNKSNLLESYRSEHEELKGLLESLPDDPGKVEAFLSSLSK